MEPLTYFATISTEWNYVIALLIGMGFIGSGFCPGRGLCAVAIGKLDGWVFTGVLLLGILIYSFVFPWLEPYYNAANPGHIKITEFLGVSEGWFIFIFAAIAIGAFYLSSIIRKRVKEVQY